jgi:hypothetical protein
MICRVGLRQVVRDGARPCISGSAACGFFLRTRRGAGEIARRNCMGQLPGNIPQTRGGPTCFGNWEPFLRGPVLPGDDSELAIGRTKTEVTFRRFTSQPYSHMPETINQPKRSRGRPPRAAPADRVRELRAVGLSFRKIARELGFGYGTIRRAYSGQAPPPPADK